MTATQSIGGLSTLAVIAATGYCTYHCLFNLPSEADVIGMLAMGSLCLW